MGIEKNLEAIYSLKIILQSENMLIILELKSIRTVHDKHVQTIVSQIIKILKFVFVLIRTVNLRTPGPYLAGKSMTRTV